MSGGIGVRVRNLRHCESASRHADTDLIMSSIVQRASAAASDPSRGAAAAASRTPRRPAPSPPVPPPPPPQAPEPLPAWLIKLRYLQQKMLWIGMPCALCFVCVPLLKNLVARGLAAKRKKGVGVEQKAETSVAPGEP